VHLWWQVLEQKGEGMVNRFGLNNVVVVKDEGEIVRDGGDFIEQSCQNRFGWRWLSQLLTKVDLPKPVGPEMRVSLC
jgi:hypothetical protein